ncbi:VOC family protein [Kitasatospora sp. DSM 101779]|uniref:VOC family protein n=1 Tax=Kitasatospora sp. DSM 101779 TaxID=2853165 RepID=UPI0021D7E853|nr:VOC family protein [Kitasatospora sp. DSM 101779]MCU7820565.1 VOC family protein [Kitasatospora sp. DSM 101779]
MIRWVYAFVDRPRERFEQAAGFWTAATGTALSQPRGADGEFATLLSQGTDACLKLQGVADGAGGAHLDLAVEDVRALTEHAVRLGASVVAEEAGLVVLASPAGQLFCAVPWHGESRRPPVFAAARLDQVALDVPGEAFEAEAAFWGGLTGWPVLTGSRPEFRVVRPPAELPVRILLHRLDDPRPAGAHLDFACADRAAARLDHEKLGAVLVAEHGHWTVMRDPAGGTYCLTDRDPHTGSLG